jgi:hypothetical protein
MFLKTICKQIDISPVPAQSLEDYIIDENVYKADFEIGERFKSFSKELCRLSLLGLTAFGFLIKLAVDSADKSLMHSLQLHRVFAIIGVASFALCAACALSDSYLGSKCLHYQLNILRHLKRLESDRWVDSDKAKSRSFVLKERTAQADALRLGSLLLLISTFSLVAGATSVAVCSTMVLLGN